jgi:hypothetical protein
MRPRLAAALIAVAIAALPACSEASKVATSGASKAARTGKPAITSKPATGRAHTRFVVSFRAPQRTTGGVPGTLRRYLVSASTRPRRGCVSTAFAGVGSPRNGARVSAKLVPGGARSWCAGAYHGKVIETVTPVCAPGKLCPAFIGVIRTIGTFTFRVRGAGGSPAPGAGTNPPPTPCIPAVAGARETCG